MGRDVPSIRFEWMSRFVMPTPVRLERSDLSTSGWKMENMETAEVRGVTDLILCWFFIQYWMRGWGSLLYFWHSHSMYCSTDTMTAGRDLDFLHFVYSLLNLFAIYFIVSPGILTKDISGILRNGTRGMCSSVLILWYWEKSLSLSRFTLRYR